MYKLRGSIIAKIIAWIVCVCGAVSTIFFSVLTYIGIQENLFNSKYENVLEDAYSYTNGKYSVEAFYNMGAGYENTFASEGFKYGIISGDVLEVIDFSNKQSYLETNMSDEELKNLDKNELYICNIREKDNGAVEYSKLGYLKNYKDLSDLVALSKRLVEQDSVEWVTQYADSVCYDTIKGIFYYRSKDYYYPAQTVELTYDIGNECWTYDYVYDFELGAYRFSTKHILVEDSNDINNDIRELEEDYSFYDTILQGDRENNGIVNFNSLETTQFNYENWNNIILDNIRHINGNELIIINSEDIENKYFINSQGYYLDEYYTLHVQKSIKVNNYWVVSIVPKKPIESVTSNYYSATWGLQLFYKYGQNAFNFMVISAILTFVSFIFLAFSAGYRRDRQGIILTWFDKIPLEMLSLFIMFVEVVLFYIIFIAVTTNIIKDIPEIFLKMICVCVASMVAFILFYILSICVRIKSRNFLKNSILYKLCNPIINGVVKIFRNLNVLKKLIFIIGVISFGEFIILLACPWGFRLIVLWFIEKLILCSAICLLAIQMHELQNAGEQMAEGNLSYKIDTTKMFWDCKKHGENLNEISKGMTKAVNERIKSERFKTELITNVSHDIKTPLTSIINYVDLLRREELNNEKAEEYLEVLDRQSTKLKKLLEDLVEASKASTGNLPVNNERLEAGVFLVQTVGEFEEKLSNIGLQLIINKPEDPIYIIADGRHLWRVTDNLMSNICKYAQSGSRVYVTLSASEDEVEIAFKNISKYPLNISGDELMERFVRGDKSRNAEGHGLGLSIAQSLTILMGGELNIIVDGDLFKAIITFKRERLEEKAFSND